MGNADRAGNGAGDRRGRPAEPEHQSHDRRQQHRRIEPPGLDRQRTAAPGVHQPVAGEGGKDARSEEHTSELQSLMRISYAVFCLKKKNNTNKTHDTTTISYVRRNTTLKQ